MQNSQNWNFLVGLSFNPFRRDQLILRNFSFLTAPLEPSKRIKAFRVSRESDCMAQTEWWFLMSSCDHFLPMINSNSDVNHFSKASWRWWFSTISIVISIFRLIVSELTIHFFSKSTFFPIFLEKKTFDRTNSIIDLL